MKQLVARSYFRIITDDATGSSRSVSLRRTAKMASGHCRMQKVAGATLKDYQG
tara:strand:+ start:1823 stop:1981 length:159 start_codon:yes stop_codon:yes gene_type:complete